MAAGAKVKGNAAGANGAGPKGGKSTKTEPKTSLASSPLTSGAATPVSEDAPKGITARVGRPDKKEYDAEHRTGICINRWGGAGEGRGKG